MKVFISEEYCYRMWELDTDKSKDEIVSWWQSHLNCSCLHSIPEVFSALGAVKQVAEDFDSEVIFHYHENSDSSLYTNGKYYKHAGWCEMEE